MIFRRAGLTSIPPKKTETPAVSGSSPQPLKISRAASGLERSVFSAGRCNCAAALFVVPVVFFCFLGVFAVLLARFGSGLWFVVFSFRWRGSSGFVRCACPSRSACVRLLWRFRAARAWVRRFGSRLGWGGVRVPVPGVSLSVPVFGLRWLACRPVSFRVSGPGFSSSAFRVSSVFAW